MADTTNKLASCVAAYTPRDPVSHADADAIRAMVTDTLNSLAKSVDEYLSAANGAVEVDAATSHEEEVIIITSPPPR